MAITPGQYSDRRYCLPTKTAIRRAHLECFPGVLQADVYAGFNELIMEAASWTHSRRKIHDGMSATFTGSTETFCFSGSSCRRL
ncbi:IS66 family transposase [Enterobacter asburiae]|uniref:IS66 family transposase n=1 Tax=Enterobacter asburiae TaxID=61645 RepID=UPI003855DC66